MGSLFKFFNNRVLAIKACYSHRKKHSTSVVRLSIREDLSVVISRYQKKLTFSELQPYVQHYYQATGDSTI